MKELSPAALAVWEAFNQEPPTMFVDYGECLAAALRAAADQVVPESIVYIPTSDGTMRRVDELWMVRRGVYAIAAELDGGAQ